MRALLTIAMLLALSLTAQAKPAPFNLRPVALSADDNAIDNGPSGATLELNYFSAPQQPYAAGRLFPCRLQLRVFDKTRLAAQSCH